MSSPHPWTEAAIVWEHTSDGEFPYRAAVDGQTLTIRVNDFPAEPLYTLLVDGKKIEDLEDWPMSWVKPDIPQSLIEMLEESRKRKQQPAP